MKKNLTIQELKLLLALYGDEHLSDELEQEVFTEEKFIRVYVNHLLSFTRRDDVTGRQYKTTYKIHCLCEQEDIRWYNAEKYLQSVNDNWWHSYKNHFNIYDGYITR